MLQIADAEACCLPTSPVIGGKSAQQNCLCVSARSLIIIQCSHDSNNCRQMQAWRCNCPSFNMQHCLLPCNFAPDAHACPVEQCPAFLGTSHAEQGLLAASPGAEQVPEFINVTGVYPGGSCWVLCDLGTLCFCHASCLDADCVAHLQVSIVRGIGIVLSLASSAF